MSASDFMKYVLENTMSEDTDVMYYRGVLYVFKDGGLTPLPFGELRDPTRLFCFLDGTFEELDSHLVEFAYRPYRELVTKLSGFIKLLNGKDPMATKLFQSLMSLLACDDNNVVTMLYQYVANPDGYFVQNTQERADSVPSPAEEYGEKLLELVMKSLDGGDSESKLLYIMEKCGESQKLIPRLIAHIENPSEHFITEQH